jgi:hypothetical protein
LEEYVHSKAGMRLKKEANIEYMKQLSNEHKIKHSTTRQPAALRQMKLMSGFGKEYRNKDYKRH